MPTLAIVGSVRRADTLNTVTVLEVSETLVTATDEISTIVLQPGGSFTPSFDQSVPASFVVISSDRVIDVEVNSFNLTCKHLTLSSTSVSSLVLTNNGTEDAEVRLIVGKP